MGSPAGPTATPAARSRSPSQSAPWSPCMASGQPSRIWCSVVHRVDLGDHVHRHLVLVPGGRRDVQAAEGVLGDVRRRLPQDVELAGVLHVVQLVAHPVLVQPLGAQLELGGGPPAGVGFVELVDVHRRHTIADQDRCAASERSPTAAAAVGAIGGGTVATVPAMPTATSKQRVALIDQMAAEWQLHRPLPDRRPVPSGTSPAATRALALLVLGPGPRPAVLPHALRPRRAHAAGLGPGPARGGGPPGQGPAAGGRRRPLRVPDAGAGPAPRAWSAWPGSCSGDGAGNGRTARSSSASSSSTTWLVLQEWSGQDRPYAVLDLLSAIRCRLRRQLFRSKDLGGRSVPLGPETADEPVRPAPETDLEELARILIDLHREGMRPEEVQVLYAHHVLGLLHGRAGRPDRTRPPRPLRPP